MLPRGPYTRCDRCRRRKVRYKSSCNFCLTEQEQRTRQEDMQRGWAKMLEVVANLSLKSLFQPSPLGERLGRLR